MHLQQTKRGSRATGGPQYYFHNLTEAVATYLRKKKIVPVALVTPYGATPSHFLAVSTDAKLKGEKVVKGSVGHDRIQQARAGQSIGEGIRDWYRLPKGVDFERISVEIEIYDDQFYLTPTGCKLVGKNRSISIQRPREPLSFNQHFQSQLWKKQLGHIRGADDKAFSWAVSEIRRIVSEHQRATTPNIVEQDLLRASGPLKILGVELGPYVGKGYDCKSEFQFLNYLPYKVPVEIKKKSSGFKYQERKYGKEELSRAVVLCLSHDLMNVPHNVDVIELSYFVKREELRF